MTKKLFFSLAIGAMLFTSCSSEEPVAGTTDGNVVFTASLPADILSRSAYDDGLTATNLQYAVYDADGTNIATLNGNGTFTDRATTVSLNLVTGKTYTVVFWADAPGNTAYTFDATTGKMTVNPAGTASDKTRDAFYAAETFTVTGAINKSITLTRPFAQINIGASDLDDFNNAGGQISQSGLKVTAPGTLNLIDGTVSDDIDYTLEATAHPTDVTFPVATTPEQKMLTTNYVLVDRAKSTLDITWTSDNASQQEVAFTHVPVQRNFRTNIYGALLTNPAQYEVKILETFEEGDNNENQDAPMTELAPGAYVDATGKIFKLTSAEGFRWFAKEHILERGQTLTLGANIDLGGEVVAPIQASWQSGAVVDGKGFTIKNVKLEGAYAALFQGVGNSGSGWVGNFKNLNIDGLTGDVTARFCGLIGNLYGSVENVHVKNVTINSAEGRVGAIVGIHNAGTLKNCSVENVEINGWWSCGGMIGCINETKNRTYDNLIVKNAKVTITGAGGYHDRTVGPLVGDINIDGIAFTNCSVIGCDTELPVNYLQHTFTWNGKTIEEQEYD